MLPDFDTIRLFSLTRRYWNTSFSDGIARTGTYCLIDMVLNRMSKGTPVFALLCWPHPSHFQKHEQAPKRLISRQHWNTSVTSGCTWFEQRPSWNLCWKPLQRKCMRSCDRCRDQPSLVADRFSFLSYHSSILSTELLMRQRVPPSLLSLFRLGTQIDCNLTMTPKSSTQTRKKIERVCSQCRNFVVPVFSNQFSSLFVSR